MNLAIEIIILVAALLSSGFCIAVLIGNRKLRSLARPIADLPVTVIVCAHNEERSISALLDALMRQNYPSHLLNIIVSCDRCTDATVDIIKKYRKNDPGIEIIEIPTVPATVSPKKFALDAAIRAACTEYLLFTDADCEPEPDWVRSISASFSRGADVVLGFSPMIGLHGCIAAYTEFETMRTAVLYAAAAALRVPYMAVGRNWAYRRTLYCNAGGLQALYHHLGGDDDLLLQAMIKLHPVVDVCFDDQSFCPTKVPTSIRELLRKKLRHYSASASYRGFPAALLGVFVATEFISLIAGPIAATVMHSMPFQTLVLCLGAKLLFDTSLLFPSAFVRRFTHRGRFARLGLMWWEWFHVIFSGIVGLAAFVKKPKW